MSGKFLLIPSVKGDSVAILFCFCGQNAAPFTRLCRSISFVCHQVTVYSILELKQIPRCQVFLKSFIQQLFLGNDVTSCNCLVKAHFYFKIVSCQ